MVNGQWTWSLDSSGLDRLVTGPLPHWTWMDHGLMVALLAYLLNAV